MHELSIALSIVDVACEELERQGGGCVDIIHIKLGPLSGVVKQALESAYELACEQSPLTGSRLQIEEEPIEIDCDICGGPRGVDSIQNICCEICGTPSAKIIRGRALEVTAMEIYDEEPAPIS
jgi:hydrogenase nickel incorporation protein HypA/HybF